MSMATRTGLNSVQPAQKWVKIAFIAARGAMSLVRSQVRVTNLNPLESNEQAILREMQRYRRTSYAVRNGDDLRSCAAPLLAPSVTTHDLMREARALRALLRGPAHAPLPENSK